MPPSYILRIRTRATTVRTAVPGLLVAGLGAATSFVVAAAIPGLSALPLAVLVGMLLGNAGLATPRLAPGLAVAAGTLLRAGIVLLGLRLAVSDLTDLGAGVIGLVFAVVVGGFLATHGLARLAGLSPRLGMLLATGFSICGASAVAAAQGVIDADEEEVAASLAAVMLFGTLSIIALPAAVEGLGLDPVTAGTWVGAAVHDVGQTVATAGAVGPDALDVAMVVKLGRVLLLGPVILALGLLLRRRGAASFPQSVVPLFVVGFIVAVGVRSLGWVPETALGPTRIASEALLASALCALGTHVQVARLRVLGPRPVLVGAAAWVVVATAALLGAVAAADSG